MNQTDTSLKEENGSGEETEGFAYDTEDMDSDRNEDGEAHSGKQKREIVCTHDEAVAGGETSRSLPAVSVPQRRTVPSHGPVRSPRFVALGLKVGIPKIRANENHPNVSPRSAQSK